MKKAFFLIAIFWLTAVFSHVSAQVTPISGDKDLRDTNVKARSNELERVNRAARKENEEKNKKKNKSKKKSEPIAETPAAPAPETPKDALAEVYPQIKEDYESMQNSQAALMTVYGDGTNIDYAKIDNLSTQIGKNAVRLSANLFPAPTVVAATESKPEVEKDAEKPIADKNLRSLLIELDEAVAAVITSPMFQNLRAVEPSVGEKTKADLQQIVKLTEAVKTEAAKVRK